MNYEAWRISFQDSEQAARAAFDKWQAARAQGGEPVAIPFAILCAETDGDGDWFKYQPLVPNSYRHLRREQSDGWKTLPVYPHPPAPSVPVNQIKANAIKEALAQATQGFSLTVVRVDELEAIAEKWRGE